MQALLILDFTGTLRRLGPILNARCPIAAKHEGVQPRIREPDDDNIGTVNIPSLAKLGSHVLNDK